MGVLIEVPLMLALVRFANRTRPAFEGRTAAVRVASLRDAPAVTVTPHTAADAE